jgi:hypothetical protein
MDYSRVLRTLDAGQRREFVFPISELKAVPEVNEVSTVPVCRIH